MYQRFEAFVNCGEEIANALVNEWCDRSKSKDFKEKQSWSQRKQNDEGTNDGLWFHQCA